MTGKVRYPGPVFKCEDMSWELRRPAPLLGQHNEEIYGKLGYDKEDLRNLRERGVI